MRALWIPIKCCWSEDYLKTGLLLGVLLFPICGNAEEGGINSLFGSAPQRQSFTTYKMEYAYATELNQPQKFVFDVIHNEKYPLSDEIDLVAVGRFHADLYNYLEPGNPGQQEVAPINRRLIIGDQLAVELREFYLKKSIGRSLLQLGKQQVVWGNADGLRVLDVVDPFRYSEFILDANEDARIPRWKVNYQMPFDNANLQLLWIPDTSYDDFPDAGSSYTITSPLYVPQSSPGVTVNQPPVQHPYKFFDDSDYGFRISGNIGTWDVSTVYLYRYDPIPVFFRTLTTTPTGPVVNVDEQYERTSLVGGTFSNAFGSTVIRGELGYNINRYFLTTDIISGQGVLKTNEFSYVFGFDFSQFEHSLISVQMFQSRLENTVPSLTRDAVDTTFTFLANRTFLNEKWLVELLWVQNINDSDGVVRPKVTYKGIDSLNIWIGADVFYGNSKGTFGQFDRQDRLLVGVKWYN